MNLKRFQEIINEVVAGIEDDKKIPMQGTEKGPEAVDVVIALSEPSMGPISATDVACAGLGFDWDAGRFLLRPNEDLVRKGYGRGTSRKLESHIDGKIVYSCSKCYIICEKDDKFCGNCGKRFWNYIEK